MVAGANVLSVHCAPQFTVSLSDFTNNLWNPVKAWLDANPTKRPQYWILFLDVPTRINECTNEFVYSCLPITNSVSYELNSAAPNHPFVTHINMNQGAGTNDCIAYIEKLVYFGSGKLVISASSQGYANTNYMIDDVHLANIEGSLSTVRDELLLSGVHSNAILYLQSIEACAGVSNYYTTNEVGGVITNSACTNWLSEPHVGTGGQVAGYTSWGSHSTLGNLYSLNGAVVWNSGARWWIISTVESFNGQPHSGHGDFWMWFSATAFGGVNFGNTPVGAITYTDEPFAERYDLSTYFGLWARGKVFAVCAWNGRGAARRFQATGDPFVAR